MLTFSTRFMQRTGLFMIFLKKEELHVRIFFTDENDVQHLTHLAFNPSTIRGGSQPKIGARLNLI